MATASTALDAKISRSPGKIGVIIFGAIFVIGVIYAGSSLLRDLQFAPGNSAMPYVLLGVALFVAIGVRIR